MGDHATPVFSSSSFYGRNKRKWIGLEREIEKTTKRHQQEKIPKPYPSRILGAPTKWETFFRQQDAFLFSRSTSKELHVFAFESESFEGNSGQRMYLVASYPVFWHYYNQLKEDKKHHYEVIPEGSVCKLYFDLEFDRTLNPDADGNSMISTFIQLMCLALKKEFKLHISREDILDLDASTNNKFSRHLVFQMKQAAFKDNIHAGRFVSYVLSKLLQKLLPLINDREGPIVQQNPSDTKPDNQHIQPTSPALTDDRTASNERLNIPVGSVPSIDHVQSIDNDENDKIKNGDKTTTDTEKGINTEQGRVSCRRELAETSNENKNGSSCHTEACEPNYQRSGCESISDPTAIDDYSDVLDEFRLEELKPFLMNNKHGQDILFCDTGVYTKNRNFRLYQSSKLHKKNPLLVSDENQYRPTMAPPPSPYKCIKMKAKTSQEQVTAEQAIFNDSLVANVLYDDRLRILSFTKKNEGGPKLNSSQTKSKSQREPGEKTLDGYNRSPYPEVDDFINNLIMQDGSGGVIRHWSYFQQGELLVYEIAKYRFCHNIGRHHKSNNIMLIADLQRGIYYQKCHDPDCHTLNYKSPEWRLPRHVLPASYFDEEIEEEADPNSDEELVNTSAELEKQFYMNQGDVGLDDGDDLALLASAEQLEATLAANTC